MKYSLIILLFVISITTASSQDSDFVVTASSDTVWGNIIRATTSTPLESVTIKHDGKKHHFKAHEVRGFSKDGDIFHTVRINNRYKFGQLMQNGTYLKLYNYTADEAGNTRSFSQAYLSKADYSGIEVPNLGFRKGLMEFLEDCPEVKQKLENKEYGKKELEQIINEYNACKEASSKTVAATPAPVPPATPAVVVEVKTPEEAQKLKSIINLKDKINQLADSGEKTEILEMLTDIESKLTNGDEIPGYLKNILQTKLQSMDALKGVSLDFLN